MFLKFDHEAGGLCQAPSLRRNTWLHSDHQRLQVGELLLKSGLSLIGVPGKSEDMDEVFKSA